MNFEKTALKSFKRTVIETLRSFSRDEKGQGLTEYLILLILVAVISIGAVQTLGTTIKRKIQTARDNINRKVDLDERD